MDEARDQDRLEPVYLVEIALLNSGPTLYLSSRDVTYQSTAYQSYLDRVDGLGNESPRGGKGSLNAHVSIVFRNDPYGQSAHLVELGDTYPFEGAGITVKEVYLDGDGNMSSSDTVFHGALEEPRDIDLMSFTCKASRMDFHRNRLFKLPVIDEATWSDAYEDLGEVEPVIYGSAERVPAPRVAWGAKTTLVDSVTAGTTTGIKLSIHDRFPSSGSVWIDEEKISYTSIASSDGALQGVTRGTGGTTASVHGAASTVWEHRTQYDSLMAGHLVKAVDTIYAELGGSLLRVESGVSAVASGGKTLLRATEQIKVLGIEEDLGVDEGSHDHDTDEQVTQLASSSLPDTDSIDNVSYYLMQVSFPSYTGTRNKVVYEVSISIQMYRDDNKTPYNPDSIKVIVAVGYTSIVMNPVHAHDYTFTVKLEVTDSSDKALNLMNISVESIEDNPVDDFDLSRMTINSSSRAIYGPAVTSPASGVQLTGGLVATREVTRFLADVQGIKDDGSGTYTGTPDALIERPDHVISHFLQVYMGFASAEIDSSSFSAAGTLYAAAIAGGYKFAFARLLPIASGGEFTRRLAREARSVLRYDGGEWLLDFVPDSAPAASKTISLEELAGEAAMFTFSRGSIIRLVNEYTGLYKRNYYPIEGGSAWDGTTVKTDAASVTKFGKYPEEVEFMAVRDSDMVEDVLDLRLKETSGQLMTVEFTVYWEHFDLQVGDTIEIDNPLFDGRKFFIEKVARGGRDKAAITAREWWA